MKAPVRIRDIAANSGETARGFLSIGETPSAALQIPVVIINGREDGPILVLTAGVHATEYAPIDAVMRVVQSLRPDELRGAVVAVPVTSMRMFEARSGFTSPIDGLNLNKVGAGKKDGSISERLAHTLLEEVISVGKYHIDLHGGDLGEMLMPFAGYCLTGDAKLDAEGEAMARLYSPRVISPSTPGSALPPFQDGIVFAASRRGIVSLFGEAGGNGTLEEADVRVHVDGVSNVMRYLGMLDGAPPVVGPRIKGRDRNLVRATRAGLLRLKIGTGDDIAAGQEVAEVVNVFGDVVERVLAPSAGIAGLVWAHKVVNTGDPIVRYWIISPD